MWVSFSFSFKFILFCLNSSYSLLRKSMQSPLQYFFSMDNLVHIFFCWFAWFFCIKGDKPDDKSGEGKTESEAQQPKPDNGDKKVPLQNFSVFSLYVQMCCLSLGLEIIRVLPLVKQAFSQKKLTHWINNNGKVLNSWPKWQVLFREHYINCNVYWLQTSGHTVYISSPDLYFTFLTLYVWCAAWWDLRMNTLTNLISFTLWSFLPFIEYYF